MPPANLQSRVKDDELVPIGADSEPVLDPAAITKFIRRHGRPLNGKASATPADVSMTLAADTVVEADKGVCKIIKGSIIKDKYKAIYKKNGFSCGDMVAEEIKEYVTIREPGRPVYMCEIRLKEIAVKNGVWKDSYGNLNKGQRRMTIGNCLRALYKDGKKLDIGGVVLFDEALQEDAP